MATMSDPVALQDDQIIKAWTSSIQAELKVEHPSKPSWSVIVAILHEVICCLAAGETEPNIWGKTDTDMGTVWSSPWSTKLQVAGDSMRWRIQFYFCIMTKKRQAFFSAPALTLDGPGNKWFHEHQYVGRSPPSKKKKKLDYYWRIRLRAGIPPPSCTCHYGSNVIKVCSRMSADALFCLWDLEIFRSLHFEKKNQSWNKENGMTEIRTANPSSEIVELPTRPRGTWRFRLVNERRRKKKTKNCSTFRTFLP